VGLVLWLHQFQKLNLTSLIAGLWEGQRQHKTKTAPFAQPFTFHPDFSAVQLHQLLCQGKPYTRSLLIAGIGRIDLLKLAKHPLLIFGRNADTRVSYADLDTLSIVNPFAHAHAPALRCKLACIGQKVEHDLLELSFISLDIKFR